MNDGTGPAVRKAVAGIGDGRIRYCETERRNNDWGNSSNELGSLMTRGEFIGHSNDDNYYAHRWRYRRIRLADAFVGGPQRLERDTTSITPPQGGRAP